MYAQAAFLFMVAMNLGAFSAATLPTPSYGPPTLRCFITGTYAGYPPWRSTPAITLGDDPGDPLWRHTLAAGEPTLPLLADLDDSSYAGVGESEVGAFMSLGAAVGGQPTLAVVM